VLWSSVRSKYYRPKCMSCVSWVSFAHPLSRSHAKHRELGHVVLLRTFSQLRAHSVKSWKESSHSAVLIYFGAPLVRAFQLKFLIQLPLDLPSLGRNTCLLQVFRAPTYWFRKYNRFSFNGSLAEVWILKTPMKIPITVPPIAVEASTTKKYVQILWDAIVLFIFLSKVMSVEHISIFVLSLSDYF
jgi:hypothetical protein